MWYGGPGQGEYLMLNNQTSVSIKLEDLKHLVRNMIAERNLLPFESVWRPSDIWLEATEYLNFIFHLPAQQLINIRLHTGFITGVPWFKYIHQPYRFWDSDRQKETIPIVFQYKEFTQNIPETYWASEPATNKIIESTAIKYKGRFITDDLLRYQRCITNLYNAGVLAHEYDHELPMVICEIGGGYGGLAHQICNVTRRKNLYILIDLPEMLFWSAAFFIINNPGKEIYVYDKNNYSNNFFEKEVYKYDIVFLPNYLTDSLKSIKAINILINMLSFQEMSEVQIREYAQIGANKLNGYLYAENFNRHWINTELARDVAVILNEYFLLYPPLTTYDRPEFRDDMSILYTYLGTSKKNPKTIAPINNLLIGQSYIIENVFS